MPTWSPIPGHPGYEASTDGQVRSIDRRVRNGNGWRTVPGRVLRPAPDRSNRPTVSLWHNNRGHTRKVSTLVAAAHMSARPDGNVLRHLNDDPWDNRVENLAWGTPSDNMNDRVRNGRDFNRNKETCKRGHLLQPPNLVRIPWEKRGHRICRACTNALSANWHYGHDVQTYADMRYADIMSGY